MAPDEERHDLSEDEPEAAEGEPLPEPEEMSTARPFPHELPQPLDSPPERPAEQDPAEGQRAAG
jgi:hypothetical protein